MYLNSQFVDITDHTYVRDPLEIMRGRVDESTETGPATAKQTLKNDDKRFSVRNPLGPYYGDLSKQVPIEHHYYFATDDFDRSSSAGWLNAKTGQAWVHFGAGGSIASTDNTVSGGAGKNSVPATVAHRSQYLSDESYLDVDIEYTVSVPFSDVTGGSIEPGNGLLRVQDTTTYYMGRVTVTSAEVVQLTIYSVVSGVETILVGPTTVSGLTFSGQKLRVRFQVEAQSLRLKVWADGGTEPLRWQAEANSRAITDPGFVGVRNGIATGNTNTLPIVFSVDDFVARVPRFTGEVAKFPGNDNAKGTDKHCKIVAADVIRRLGQGTTPVMSSLKRGNLSIGAPLVAYWPCEDGDNSTAIASAIAGAPEMRTIPAPDFATNDNFPCSQPIPSVAGSGWFGDPPAHTYTASYQTRFLVTVPAAGAGVTDVVLLRILMENCTAPVWELVYYTGADGQLAVIVYDQNNTQIHNSGAIAFSLHGNPTRLSLELDVVGGDIAWNLSALRLDLTGGGISGTLAGRTMGPMRQVMITPQAFANVNMAVGHVTLENQITNLFANSNELTAWRGERALTRMFRVCAENDIPFYWQTTGTNVTPEMGFQRPDTVLNILRECARTDGGSLFSPRGTIGVEYRTRTSLYTQAARVTADLSQGQLGHPFAPIEDDQQTKNDIEVRNVKGASARAVLETGRLSVQDYPNGISRFDTSVDVNLYRQGELNDHAQFRLAIGTVDEPRYPDIRFELEAPPAASLRRSLLMLNIDDRLVINNAAEQTGIYDPISQIARGLKEVWTNHRCTIYVNASPESPYAIAEVEGNARLDSGSSTLSGALSAAAAGTFSVATSDSGDLWITTATHASHFPVDIMIGGERITISGITGATSPQTFTISNRGVNGVHQPGAIGKAHLSGAAVHVYEPVRLGL